MNKTNRNLDEIVVGDQVIFIDRMISGETQNIMAEVIEIRHILGKQTYVVETENGSRKMVGANQISKIESA